MSRPFRKRVGTFAAMILAVMVAAQASAAELDPILCTPTAVQVAVVEGGPADQTLYGELCRPRNHHPAVVQLLVHGGTYTHAYWDWPDRKVLYSYVNAAVLAGYATFAVDRIGSGESSHPASQAVNLDSSVTALHDVVVQLRSGALGGRPFQRIVWVGHSLGSGCGWRYASRYRDIDAYLLTGMMHIMKLSLASNLMASMVPAGGELDPGYLTTLPDTRSSAFFYTPTVEAAVLTRDEALKSTVTIGELEQANAPVDPGAAPSQSITVPTLLVIGEEDALFCGPPDGVTCTPTGILEAEAQYYSSEAQLEAAVIPLTGHCLNLHVTAPLTYFTMLRWLYRVAPPR